MGKPSFVGEGPKEEKKVEDEGLSDQAAGGKGERAAKVDQKGGRLKKKNRKEKKERGTLPRGQEGARGAASHPSGKKNRGQGTKQGGKKKR